MIGAPASGPTPHDDPANALHRDAQACDVGNPSHRAIRETCTLAGRPDLAGRFIAAGMTERQAVTALLFVVTADAPPCDVPRC